MPGAVVMKDAAVFVRVAGNEVHVHPFTAGSWVDGETGWAKSWRIKRIWPYGAKLGRRAMKIRDGFKALAWSIAMIGSFLLLTPKVQASQPIRIGWVGPLSPPGDFAAGEEMKWAAELATEQINKAGGILGSKLVVIYDDTMGEPAQGSDAMERLITNDHVVAVFGEFHSSVALAEIDVAHKYGIPWVATDVWANKITAMQYPEVFRPSPCNAVIFRRTANWIKEAGFKDVAIIQATTDYAQGASEILQKELKKIPGVKVQAVTVQFNQQDFRPILMRLKHEMPNMDLLVSIDASNGVYQILQQASNLGIAPTSKTGFYMSGGPALEKEFWTVDGNAGNYVVAEDPTLPKSQWGQKAKDFVQAFTARFKRPPTGTAMESYDDLELLVHAIETAKSTKPAAIIHALEHIQYAGTRGTYSFSNKKQPAWAYHQWLDAPVMIIQYTQVNQSADSAPILYPRNWATSKKIYNRP